MNLSSNFEILAKPIALLVASCAIATCFIGPAAFLLWIAIGFGIFVVLRYG